MALTSSTLKAKITERIKALYGADADDPAVLNKFSESVAKAVVQWMAANGIGAVSTPLASGGSSTLAGNLSATDDI